MSEAKKCDICGKYDEGMWAHIQRERVRAGVRLEVYGLTYDYDVCSPECARRTIDKMAQP